MYHTPQRTSQSNEHAYSSLPVASQTLQNTSGEGSIKSCSTRVHFDPASATSEYIFLPEKSISATSVGACVHTISSSGAKKLPDGDAYVFDEYQENSSSSRRHIETESRNSAAEQCNVNRSCKTCEIESGRDNVHSEVMAQVEQQQKQLNVAENVNFGLFVSLDKILQESSAVSSMTSRSAYSEVGDHMLSETSSTPSSDRQQHARDNENVGLNDTSDEPSGIGIVSDAVTSQGVSDYVQIETPLSVVVASQHQSDEIETLDLDSYVQTTNLRTNLDE